MAKAKRKTLPKDFEELLKTGDVAALKAVFDSCDVDARGGYYKRTALAYSECPDELTRWLVAEGADLAAADSYGETPLHHRAGHWQGGVELLIELGADVNHDAGGRATPLHRAADGGLLKSVQALLDHGANPNLTNDKGQTPLEFALQRCSNIKIERLAPKAELLLAAMAATPQKPQSFLGRLLGGGAGAGSPITPAMQKYVQRIGADFEFHRAGFNTEHVSASSEALDRLYAMFDVPPAPRRMMHDGTSDIAAKPGTWQKQHQELWQLLVPSGGAAATVQGEVIRLSGRIADELDRNGGVQLGQGLPQDGRRLPGACRFGNAAAPSGTGGRAPDRGRCQRP